MAKPEWGLKRTCTTCGARFYDMQRQPIVCPKCGAENDKDVAKAKRGAGKGSRADAVKKVAVAKVVVDELDEDDLLTTEEDTDDDLMEDASDLGEDDEDMAEVIEHIEPGDEDE